MDQLLQADVWVPLAIVLFGILVVWGAVRDFRKEGSLERSAVKVTGTIVEIVPVDVKGHTRPMASAIVEYTRGLETKRFQTEPLATLHWPVEPKSYRRPGDSHPDRRRRTVDGPSCGEGRRAHCSDPYGPRGDRMRLRRPPLSAGRLIERDGRSHRSSALLQRRTIIDPP